MPFREWLQSFYNEMDTSTDKREEKVAEALAEVIEEFDRRLEGPTSVDFFRGWIQEHVWTERLNVEEEKSEE